MKTYSLFIDETGDFSLKSTSSFVGGCGAEKNTLIKFINDIGITLNNEFNAYPNLIFSPNIKRQFQSLLHFTDLYRITLFNSPISDKYPCKNLNKEQASNIINITKKYLINYQLDLYKVTGELNLYNGPQGNYLFQLSGLLIGAIEKNTSYDRFEFRIATRNFDAIFGNGFLSNYINSESENDFIFLHNHYKELLEILIKHHYPNKEIEIKFFVCNKDELLPFADMAIGILKNYSSELNNNCIFKFSADEYIQKITPTPTLLQTFLVGSKECVKNESHSLSPKCLVLFDILKTDLQSLNEISAAVKTLNAKDSLIHELDLFIFQSFNDYYHTYKYTNTKLVRIVLKNLIELEKFDSEIKLIKTFAFSFRIDFELDIHSGLANTSKWEKFEKYCLNHQKFLFKTPIEYFMAILSAKLVFCQTLFNSLDFHKIEDFLKPDKLVWQNINSSLKLSPNHQDYITAEICGSLGQAYIFLGDLENDPLYLQEGLIELEKDIKLLDKSSREYEQVANYIVTYYWLQNNLTSSLNAFQNFDNAPSENNLLSLTKTGSFTYANPINNDNNVYKYLNQLRLIALSIENGKILSKDTLENIKIQIEKLCEKEIAYPKFMILKWLCYIYHKQLNEIPVCVIGKLKTTQCIEAPLLKMMVFPLYYLIGNKELYLTKINEFDAYCQSEGAKSFLIHRKPLIDKIIAGSATTTEVMRLMPYYYA